jgi:hypothetical protein
MFGFKHTMRNVAKMGLCILHKLLQSINSYPEAAHAFFKVKYRWKCKFVYAVKANLNCNFRLRQTFVQKCFLKATMDRLVFIYRSTTSKYWNTYSVFSLTPYTPVIFPCMRRFWYKIRFIFEKALVPLFLLSVLGLHV